MAKNVFPNRHHTQGFQWLNESAKWNNPAAHTMLGVKYRDGTGVPRNPEKAYFHFDRAAKFGEVVLCVVGCFDVCAYMRTQTLITCADINMCTGHLVR